MENAVNTTYEITTKTLDTLTADSFERVEMLARIIGENNILEIERIDQDTNGFVEVTDVQVKFTPDVVNSTWEVVFTGGSVVSYDSFDKVKDVTKSLSSDFVSVITRRDVMEFGDDRFTVIK